MSNGDDLGFKPIAPADDLGFKPISTAAEPKGVPSLWQAATKPVGKDVNVEYQKINQKISDFIAKHAPEKTPDWLLKGTVRTARAPLDIMGAIAESGRRSLSPLGVGAMGAGALSQMPAVPGALKTAINVGGTGAGIGFGIKGGAEALTGRQEGETREQEIERRVGGAGQAVMGIPSLSHAGASTKSAVQSKLSSDPPERLMTKAVKPSATKTDFETSVSTAMPDLKKAEAILGRPVKSIGDAIEATTLAKKAVWKEYEATVHQAQKVFPNAPSMSTIDGNAIADRMVSSIDKRTRVQSPELAEKIQRIADTYRRPITLEEAEDFLQSANNELHSFYAKNKVGQSVAAKDPTTGHIVAEAEGLRAELYKTLNQLTGKNAAAIKKRYGSLASMEDSMLRRKIVADRQQPTSLSEQIGRWAGAGKLVKGIFTGSLAEAASGIAEAGAAKWLKEQQTTDALIEKAFANYGKAPVKKPQMPISPAALVGVQQSGSAPLP